MYVQLLGKELSIYLRIYHFKCFKCLDFTDKYFY